MITKLSEKAIKSLSTIDKKDAKRIKDRIKKFIDEPENCNFKKLRGHNAKYRIRQGNYRIICEFMKGSEEILFVIDIKHRGSAYKE